MYNTKHICTYCDDNIFSEKEKNILKQYEQDTVLNCLYRNDLLYIFDLDDINDFDNFHKRLFKLYEKIKDNDFILSCIKKLNEKYNIFEDVSEKNEMLGVLVLYSFDYLYLIHPCVCEFLDTGIISDKNVNLLKEKVFS